jgi:hypothetical protein
LDSQRQMIRIQSSPNKDMRIKQEFQGSP